MIATLVAFALVLSSCADSNSPTASQTTASQQHRSGNEQKATSSWQDFYASIYNPCCDDYLELTAKYHLVTKGDGSRAKVNLAKLVGTGSTGNTYHGTAGASQTFNEDGAWKYREHWTLSSADGCHFQYTIEYHYELDEFGNYIFIIDKQEIKRV